MGISAPPPDLPLILKGSDGKRRVVSACDDFASQLGISVGMTVAKAQTIVADMTIMDSQPDADADGLEKLAIWALRQYSPLVASDQPDGLILDITGAAHLHGGESGLLADILGRLADLGVTAQGAIADTWGAAHALARFRAKPSLIAPAGATIDAILPLPVTALRLPADTIEDLRILGIDTIGELASKPRAPLAHRFGQLLWRRVDMAFGRLAEPITPVEAPELISVRRVFAEPIGAPETLEKYTRRLTEAICDKLEEACAGSKRLDLNFYRVDNRIESISVTTAKPVRNVKRLSRLLVDKIETVDPGFGIEAMTLTAVMAEPLAQTQTAAAFAEAPEADLDDLWDRLANRYGNDKLFRVVSVATDIPERAVRKIPPNRVETGSRRNARYRRPFRMLARPERVQTLALLPDHPPASFTWRDHRYRVSRADGPERVKGEWWVSDRETGQVRDYFILEVDGGERFWVFRAGDGQHAGTGSLSWYMHGKFA